MARIIAGVASSHVPAIGAAIDNKQTEEPYWKRVFSGFEKSKEWMAKTKPDVAIVVYNDHASAFSVEVVPTFLGITLLVFQKVSFEQVIRRAIEGNARTQQMPPDQRENIIRQQSGPIGKAIAYAIPTVGVAVVIAAGAALYLLGVIAVTMAFNVPRNDALARLDPAAPEAVTYWRRYLSEWTAWNHVRTVAPLIGAGLQIAALYVD